MDSKPWYRREKANAKEDDVGHSMFNTLGNKNNQYAGIPEVGGDFPPPETKKPIIYVIPRRIWLHQRAIDLTSAISQFVEAEQYENVYESALVDELNEILHELRSIKTLND